MRGLNFHRARLPTDRRGRFPEIEAQDSTDGVDEFAQRSAAARSGTWTGFAERPLRVSGEQWSKPILANGGGGSRRWELRSRRRDSS